MSSPSRVSARLLVALLAAAAATVPATAAVAATTAAECRIDDAGLDWGFKESFRAYIDGTIANGEWTTDGDASYTTPEFRFSGGRGALSPATGELVLDFEGSIRFTGHGGVLDTTFANPRVVVDRLGTMTVSLDVAGETMAGDEVGLRAVPFVASDVESRSGSAWGLLASSPTLTPDGSAAFPDYPEGEVFDPVLVTADLDEACATAIAAAQEERALPGRIGIIAGAALLVASAAVLAIVLLRRRTVS